ncbi:D-alanine-D-alanine ligase [Paenibacillus rhizosphaerae]|uniref:D-alanine--D-alanine ligase n=1 Tax=Paenibacillus rhizosphaerae TaxID=297318 RepID=A0A839THK6_9BACL|nr:D-alanine--D-alanine ligase [Paenibacillus rhizosphaerae]MBB3126124.1 D-alanine-D-alanine ligase [Paenibacillus rhizosphaerae]
MLSVGVIMGGDSSEREVSLMTGREIISHLDPAKYEVRAIEIARKRDLPQQLAGIDMAVIALHGKYGEDGTIQGTLETLGVPFTGSGVLASSLCMDKNMAKKLLRYEGVETPDWMLLTSPDELDDVLASKPVYPLVVKPNTGGSSVGVTLARDAQGLREAVERAFHWDDEVILEQYIEGEEITCSLLNGEYLPVLSIKPNGEFFDYTSKYEEGESEEAVASLDPDTAERVRVAAELSWRVLKCSVYARVDVMLHQGIPYVMEVNTLPGMTRTSLLPKSAQAAGISFSALLDRIIEGSLAERRREYGHVV